MRGWELLTKIKEGFSKLVPLRILKESNPVDLAQYAVTNKIEHEPAFDWGVQFTLIKWNMIFSKL